MKLLLLFGFSLLTLWHRTCKIRHFQRNLKKLSIFSSKREKTSPKHEVLIEKLKTVLPALILKKKSRPLTSQNFKTHKTFVVQRFLLHTYTSISKVYTILLSRDLKTKKVRHQHPHPHTQNKKIISVPTTKILIKYKRIKWTPSRKASLLIPGGN